MERLKNIGTYMLSACIFLAIIFIPILFIFGSLELSKVLIPWLGFFCWIVFFIDILILLPLCLFSRTRPYAGVGLFCSSFAYGIALWFLGLLLTYALWGIMGIIIGLFIFGIGVVPVAILATLFAGLWGGFWLLIFLSILTFGTRIIGLILVENS